MSYQEMKSRALSHGFVVGIAVVVITLLTAGTAIVAAADSAPAKQRYQLTYNVTPKGTRQFIISSQITDTADGSVVWSPRGTTQAGIHVSLQSDPDEDKLARTFKLDFDVKPGGASTGTMVVLEKGVELQRSLVTRNHTEARRDTKFNGEPISINLKNADAQDVFKVMGQLTGYTFMVPARITGRVTLDVTNMPWDQALDQICSENGLHYRIEGKTIYITM